MTPSKTLSPKSLWLVAIHTMTTISLCCDTGFGVNYRNDES